MSNKSIVLAFFIDAFGWEMCQENPFLPDILSHQRKLKSVYGFSSACVPSILTGVYPSEHGYWAGFNYAPVSSPFKFLKPLSLLPSVITARSPVRRRISKWAKKRAHIKGYFNLYNIPLDKAGVLDYNEKINFYDLGTMAPCHTVFDVAHSKNAPYFCYSQKVTEDANLDALSRELPNEKITFSYIAFGRIDALLHLNDRKSEAVKSQINHYSTRLKAIYELACRHYADVTMLVFSDHDMAPVKRIVDMQSVIRALPVTEYKDYAVAYDSTMLRFWFLSDHGKRIITEALSNHSEGHIVTDDTLKAEKVFFPSGKFGDMIFQLPEGSLVIPSDMGEKPIHGMHGYEPHNRHSFASLMSTKPIPETITAIPDIHQMIISEIKEQP